MLIILRLFGLIGSLVFGALLLVVIQNPKAFERSALGFVKKQIETEIRERYPTIGADRLVGGLSKFSDKLWSQQTDLRAPMNSELPEFIAAVVSVYCGCSHDRAADIRERAEAIRQSWDERFQQLGDARERLSDIIKGKYDAIVAALRMDIMIFLGSNLVAFTCVFGTSFAPRERRGLVKLPATLLLVAVGLSTWYYLFDQDWFYSIVFQDYFGYGYSAIILVIFGFLVDITMNRARVTWQIASSLPSAFTVPC